MKCDGALGTRTNKISRMFSLERSEREHYTPRRRRRWTIPPAPSFSCRHFDGLPILEELPAPIAVLLFQRFRDVQLWAASPVPQREGLFRHPSAELTDPLTVPTDLPESVLTALALLDALRASPDRAKLKDISRACALIGEWADLNGYPEAERHFRSLAAHAEPRSAPAAFAAGRAERRAGNFPTAEQWFLRAIGLARRLDDPDTYADALIGLGILEEARRRPSEARRAYTLAWRAAMRAGLRKIAAAARHNMIPLSLYSGSLEQGIAHATAAYKLYGRDPRLARLAIDTGALLSEFGHFSAALSLYEVALPQVRRPAVRAAALANIARAASAVGDHTRYAEVWREVDLDERRGQQSLIPILLELARAARNVGDKRRVYGLLREADRLASTSTERSVLDSTRAAMEDLRREDAEVDRDRPASAPVSSFVRRFVTRLLRYGVAEPGQ